MRARNGLAVLAASFFLIGVCRPADTHTTESQIGNTSSPQAPPVAAVKPFTDGYHGSKVSDPYRYMENLQDPALAPSDDDKYLAVTIIPGGSQIDGELIQAVAPATVAQQTLSIASIAPSTGACYLDNWVEVASGSVDWYVEPSSSHYWSVKNGKVVVSGVSDEFTITNIGSGGETGTTGYILDVTVGEYLYPDPSSNTTIYAGSKPYTWDFGSVCPSTSTPSGTPTVQPMGDSITWGLDTEASEVQGGYRCAFYWNAINTLGATIDLVGTSQNIPNPTGTYVWPVNVGNNWPGCPENAQGWSGYGGLTIPQIVYGGTVPGTSYKYPGALGDVETYKPNVIIFQGGTNDIFQGLASSVSTNLTKVLNSIWTDDPGALIVVAEIPGILASYNVSFR